MNNLSYDVMFLITTNLPIEDLNSLQRTCRHLWVGLKSKKLSSVWHGKYLNYFHKSRSNRSYSQEYKKVYVEIVDVLIEYKLAVGCYYCNTGIKTKRLQQIEKNYPLHCKFLGPIQLCGNCKERRADESR